MKSLVVYYSRTGTTAKVANELADSLSSDIEEIKDKKNRQGIIRWFFAGRDGYMKKDTLIEKTQYDSSGYDFVVIGTPIWVNTTPAVRTYLKRNKKIFKKVAFFCTMGGSGGESAFEEMEDIIGKKPIATLELKEKDVKSGNYKNTLQEFISKIK